MKLNLWIEDFEGNLKLARDEHSLAVHILNSWDFGEQLHTNTGQLIFNPKDEPKVNDERLNNYDLTICIDEKHHLLTLKHKRTGQYYESNHGLEVTHGNIEEDS